MSRYKFIIAGTLCAAIAGCGETLAEQGLSGAAIGAGAAALTSGSLVQGAAIGAAGNLAFCQLNPGKCKTPLL